MMHYPEYSKNDFYITGESYGGVYVPTLAARVMEDTQINFKVNDNRQFSHLKIENTFVGNNNVYCTSISQYCLT